MDDLHQPEVLGGLALSESDLMNLHQAGVLVTSSGASHFSQTELEALASIQEDFDQFTMESSGQHSSGSITTEEMVNMADLDKEVRSLVNQPQFDLDTSHMTGGMTGVEEEDHLQLSDVESMVMDTEMIGPDLTAVPLSTPQLSESLETTMAHGTVQIVRAPTVAQGQGFNKVKIRSGVGGSTTHQIRIVSAGAKNLTPGGQLKFLSVLPSSNTATKLSTSSPVEQLPTVNRSSSSLSIVNGDGSVTSVPVHIGGHQSIKILNADGSLSSLANINDGHLEIGNKLPTVTQSAASFKIISPVSSVGTTFGSHQTIRVLGPADAKQRTVVNSSSFLNMRNSPSKQQQPLSPLKAIAIKPEQGQILRTVDGRLISLSGKSLILSSPTKVLKLPQQQEQQQHQLIRLDATPAPLGGSAAPVQYVRVLNAAGQTQTIQIHPPEKPKVVHLQHANTVQGIKSVVPGNITTITFQPFKQDSCSLRVVPANSAKTETLQIKKEIRALTSSNAVSSATSPALIEPQGVRPRKACNCTKSMCLKLYCDCFANGEFCFNCNCINCHNNLENEEERQKSIRQCLDRNPNAFRPKIGKNPAESERRHAKGCNCKRSGCLKNYCECYEAKIACSDICKCLGCKNLDERTGFKAFSSDDSLSTPLNMADRWFKPTSSLRSKLLQGTTSASASASLSGAERTLIIGGHPQNQTQKKQLPFSFVTQEVVEATCQCLLAQAEEGEKGGLDEEEIEHQVLEEFGRCLAQIIDFAKKRAKQQQQQPSSSQNLMY